MTIALEYLNRFEAYFLNTAAQARAFVERVGHPHLRTMYDTFHGHIEEKHHAEAIRTVAPVLAHFHVSENDRGVPGSGPGALRRGLRAPSARPPMTTGSRSRPSAAPSPTWQQPQESGAPSSKGNPTCTPQAWP